MVAVLRDGATVTSARRKIIADVVDRKSADRRLSDEPLSADDWRRVYELKQGFIAAVRQVVLDARLREKSTKARRSDSEG